MAEDDTTDVFDTSVPKSKKLPPPYRVYEGARVPVSRAVGKAWKSRYDAAVAAYESIWEVWEEVYRYYNNDQTKSVDTPRGKFKRGDGTENLVFSNTNVILPAVYSRNPDIAVNTGDEADKPFCEAAEALLNVIFQRRDILNAKPKIKKAVGLGHLTNMGVLKLDFTQKDDSREVVVQQLEEIGRKLAKAKNQQAVKELEGQLQALEVQMEVSEPSGPKLYNILPHNLIIDPEAEQPDGGDANWMIERVLLPTEMLTARYTRKDEDGHVLVYKPTHKASFTAGDRDDGIGMVLEAITTNATMPTSYTDDERLSYLYTYMTECFFVWDKVTRRVLLFQRDDWTWPLWVWDDPLGLTRFFPYFILSFTMNIGGTVGVGETAYYLDQQDEVNNINRQRNRIRETVFNYFFYNSSVIKSDDAEPLIKALRGLTPPTKTAVGIKLPEGMKLEEVFQALLPPSAEYSALFDKEPALTASNRINNTNDALRGVQFKANTNEAAVNTYQQAMRLSIDAKVDVIEDMTSELAWALLELCVLNYDPQTVAGLIGEAKAQGWKQMGLEELHSQYSCEIVAGSMEKPNSVFKKKEAVEIAQAVGQFAQAAPGATLRVMLRVLEQAFTEVVIKPEDWDALEQEIAATLQKGVSAPGQEQGQAQGQTPDIDAMLAQLPEQEKARIAAMAQGGASREQVLTALQQGKQQGKPTNAPSQ
jgi:hypothetical protein